MSVRLSGREKVLLLPSGNKMASNTLLLLPFSYIDRDSHGEREKERDGSSYSYAGRALPWYVTHQKKMS